ncbi:kinesin motor domain-containing protein [Pisolithus tinctorius]|nr:kinesin motor domain-containing protein [Pisolithus tinctorius]
MSVGDDGGEVRTAKDCGVKWRWINVTICGAQPDSRVNYDHQVPAGPSHFIPSSDRVPVIYRREKDSTIGPSGELVPYSPQTCLSRAVPFTPGRPASVSSSSDIPRATAPSILGTTAKKYKAALSAESRLRTNKSSLPVLLSPVPGSPPKASCYDDTRPKAPSTPRGTCPNPAIFMSPGDMSMDLSRVDPEEVLVDYQTVEPGDVSGDLEDDNQIPDYGKEDKVLISIWYIRRLALRGRDVLTLLLAFALQPVTRLGIHQYRKASNFFRNVQSQHLTPSGNEDQPGIIPRAMKDAFAHIRRTSTREYLLRCSYLEIYNETIYDLLVPPSVAATQPVQLIGQGILSPLREEVVTSLKSVREVMERGERHRKTASTDWNERSSRSHSVFRLVIESRERGEGKPGASGRQTPGLRPGTPRIQAANDNGFLITGMVNTSCL